jgi:hypothetical protein
VDGGIITLPLRASVGWTRLLLRTGVDVAGCAVKAGGKVAAAATDLVGGTGDALSSARPAPTVDAPASDGAPVREPAPPPPFDQPGPARPGFDLPAPARPAFDQPAEPAPAPPAFDQPAEPAPAAPALDEPAEPAHVSEEPELVSEFAEPGAEDGAGASVTIAEPWPGYDQMPAGRVVARLAGATPAELAAVQLYESSNRDRQTVRAAVERSLKTKTGRGSPDRKE